MEGTSRLGVELRDGVASFLRFIRDAMARRAAAFSLSSSSSSSNMLASLSEGASCRWDDEDG